jgi:hypothetical protein
MREMRTQDSVKHCMSCKTAPNASARGEIDFLRFPRLRTTKLVVRLSYDELDAFRERYLDALRDDSRLLQ